MTGKKFMCLKKVLIFNNKCININRGVDETFESLPSLVTNSERRGFVGSIRVGVLSTTN